MAPRDPRGRKRSHNPSIPGHIDQGKLPDKIYWKPSGKNKGEGSWYTQFKDETGRLKNKTLAGRYATLSELHKAMEEFQGIDRNNLRWLCQSFEKSKQFQELSDASQRDYRYCAKTVCSYPTKIPNKLLGDIPLTRWDSPLVQKLIDKISEEGNPAKANHILRYLRRLFRWGKARGHVASIPTEAVEQARERKQRRLPKEKAYQAVLDYCKTRGALDGRAKGSCSAYLWIVMELAYLCRLRGIEVIEMTDAHASPEGLLADRRKGSRDNIVEWNPRLRTAWDAAIELRNKTARIALPDAPEKRWVFLASDGDHLRKSSLDTAWQRMIKQAIAEGVIIAEERFSPHDLKRKGGTDTAGNRAEKQDALGHRSESMMNVYDLSIPKVKPSSE